MRKSTDKAETSDAPAPTRPAAERAPEPSAVERLRKLEADLLGDPPNERGHGSTFQRLTPAQKAQFAALENQIKAEAALAVAQAAYNAAVEAADKAKANAAA